MYNFDNCYVDKMSSEELGMEIVCIEFCYSVLDKVCCGEKSHTSEIYYFLDEFRSVLIEEILKRYCLFFLDTELFDEYVKLLDDND